MSGDIRAHPTEQDGYEPQVAPDPAAADAEAAPDPAAAERHFPVPEGYMPTSHTSTDGRGKGHGCRHGEGSEATKEHAEDEEAGSESGDDADRDHGGWQFTHGADAEVESGTCYVVTFCRKQPSVVGIWCRKCWPWDEFQKQLPTGKFITSGAKLKRFEKENEGIEFFRATRHGSKAAERDGLGLEPVRFCHCY